MRFAPSGGLIGAREWKKGKNQKEDAMLLGKMFVKEFRKVIASFEGANSKQARAELMEKYSCTPRRSIDASRIELTKTILAGHSQVFEDELNTMVATCQHCQL